VGGRGSIASWQALAGWLAVLYIRTVPRRLRKSGFHNHNHNRSRTRPIGLECGGPHGETTPAGLDVVGGAIRAMWYMYMKGEI
jgi:hypothetical protein